MKVYDLTLPTIASFTILHTNDDTVTSYISTVCLVYLDPGPVVTAVETGLEH